MNIILFCRDCRTENVIDMTSLERKKSKGIISVVGYTCDGCGAWHPILNTNPGVDSMLSKLESMKATHKSFPYLFRKAYARVKRMQESQNAH